MSGAQELFEQMDAELAAALAEREADVALYFLMPRDALARSEWDLSFVDAQSC